MRRGQAAQSGEERDGGIGIFCLLLRRCVHGSPGFALISAAFDFCTSAMRLIACTTPDLARSSVKSIAIVWLAPPFNVGTRPAWRSTLRGLGKLTPGSMPIT